MKRNSIAILMFAIGTALGTSAYAQGRHDDKAHGMPKDMPMTTESTGAPAPAGRHDEKPHGQKKPATKPATDQAAKEKASQAK